MTKTIIFDLSEVLISGLIGAEKLLSARLQRAEADILWGLGGAGLHQLLCGNCSEDAYLGRVLQTHGWPIALEEVKEIVRRNFQQQVPGMQALVADLAGRHDLVLLSDHAREWVEYIRGFHPFLQVFRQQFFSFELRQTKREASSFMRVLGALGRRPTECLFIDDAAMNVAAARTAGIPALRFETTATLSHQLAALNLLPFLPSVMAPFPGHPLRPSL
jgi:beta-phosphoglucomutase-like phosphatase (HAD superfamily)